MILIPNTLPFPVVGIGASAGGLEALEDFFRPMPPATGMAFVVVSHQSPGHTSLLPELLAKCTEMNPVLAEQGMKVEPNCIYINPPGHNLSIREGILQLAESTPRGIGPLPIDYFFRSLAIERREHAICVILSGTATDGTVGLRDIKAETGLVLAQEPTTAKYSGMPQSAIGTGLVDYVLPPGDMAAAIISFIEAANSEATQLATPAELIAPESLDRILTLLREISGHDFALYKRNMIARRVLRRMTVTRERSPQEYIRFLEAHPQEAALLMKELLISVTNFFRDPEAFRALGRVALPQFVESKPHGSSLRAWCPGCATGEEVYSLSIALAEIIEAQPNKLNIQIFGTDLDREAIDIARRGEYAAGIAMDVSPLRLDRFFVATNDRFRIRKEVREKIIFAVQDLIKDPPFTKLDIIFCRNLLIYMDSALQKRVLSMFHYALNPGGVLFLGTSETLGGVDDLFQVVDKKWRIFTRKEGSTFYAPPTYPFAPVNPHNRSTHFPKLNERPGKADISTTAERILAARYAPPSAIVNERGDIFYIHGKAGAFLEPAPGKQPNNNILSMAREGLSLPLASVLRRASTERREVVQENVRVRSNGEFTPINIAAEALDGPASLRSLILISFVVVKEELNAPSARDDDTPAAEKSETLLDIERELQYTRENLHDLVEQLQTSNEELQSANEELQSSNEELETSREELQSLNEELQTVNTELNSKVEQLSRTKDDMQNLLDGIDIATIFLDGSLRIRRFTKPATTIIKMIDSDLGRPIGDLALNLNYEHLVTDAEAVLETLITRELEVQTKTGTWCLMRISPYRTQENAVEGLVITFIDITKLKDAEARAVG